MQFQSAIYIFLPFWVLCFARKVIFSQLRQIATVLTQLYSSKPFFCFVQKSLSPKRAFASCPILPRLLRRRHDKLPDKASTRRPPIASHAVVRNAHTLMTQDRPPRQHKKAALPGRLNLH